MFTHHDIVACDQAGTNTLLEIHIESLKKADQI